MKSNRLSDGVIYERYGIYVSNLKTFTDILGDVMPRIHSTRGNYCVKVNTNSLIKLRNRAGLTQKELAKKIDVSKQSIFRYEDSGSMSLDVYKSLLDFFEREDDLLLPAFELHKQEKPAVQESVAAHVSNIKGRVVEGFMRLGFKTRVTNAPFDVVAEDKDFVFTVVSNDWHRLKHKINILEEISEVLGAYSMCFSNRKAGDSHVFKPEELEELSSTKELFRILRD